MILERILEQKRHQVAQIQPIMRKLLRSEVDFLPAITTPGLNIIGEVKQKSPSTGILCAQYDPATLALQYQQGGAAAISVLTDTPFFGGVMQDIEIVKAATSLPVLCKDFIIDIRQIELARSLGADAILLIMRILEPQQAKDLKAAIEALGMLALIEIFDEPDLEKALALEPKVLMINHRNLDTLALDKEIDSLITQIPSHLPLVAASGITAPEQILALSPRFNAVLIGTGLLQSPNPAAFIQQMRKLK